MPSILAIVSKAVFERDARRDGRRLEPGDVWDTDRYVSQNRGLVPLSEGGDLYLVTVRPPDEALWLVAILERPENDGAQWVARPNVAPIRVVTDERQRLRFSTGTGIKAKPGALGMSLQTPRQLTAEDEALLRQAPSPGPRAKQPARAAEPPPEPLPKRKRPARSRPAPPPARVGSATGSRELTRALAELEAGRAGAALSLVLAAWRGQRAVELADLLDVITRQVQRSLPPLEGPRGELQQRWLDLAAQRRPVDVGRLLASLGEGSMVQLRKRYELLGCLAPDPRLPGPALQIPTRYHSYEAGPLFTAAFDIATRTGDPRTVAAIDDLLGGFFVPKKGDSRAWKEHLAKHARRAAKVRAGLPAPPELGADDAELVRRCDAACRALLERDAPDEHTLLAELEAEPAAGGDDLATKLLAAVLENPDDDGPRLVYCDFLLERGDPRGELIALQLKRARDGRLPAGEQRRERQLLKEHGREWIAPLDACIDPGSMRFARGFLDACAVTFKTAAQKKELVGHPLFATVRELDCGDMDLVTHPGLRSLRRATATPRALAALAARPSPVPLEAVIGPTEMYYGLRMRRGIGVSNPRAWGRALDVGALTSLRSLELCLWARTDDSEDADETAPVPESVAWLLDSPLGRQLDEVDLLAGRDAPPVLRWAEELHRRPGLQRVRLRFTNANTASGTGEILVVLELAREAGEVVLRLSTNNDMVDIRYLSIGGQIDRALGGLPSDRLRRLTVVYTGSKRARQPGFPAIAGLLRQRFATVEMPG